MKRQLLAMLIAATIGFGACLMTTGCVSDRTEGQQTLAKANRIEDAGEMIRRGEMYVSQGKATEARGRAIKEQGDEVTGDRLIGEGKANQEKGEELIEQGRKLRDK